MSGYRELVLVVDHRWAVEHPEQAKAIYRKHIRRYLGLDNLRGDSVLQPKPGPKRKRKLKTKPVYAPPLGADGVPMVKATELGPRLGYGRYSVKNWVVRGHICGIVQTEVGKPRLYVSEAEAREYLVTKAPQGRKRRGESDANTQD